MNPEVQMDRSLEPRSPERIMLVEDDPSERETLEEVLREHGYLVTTAENGRQALELLRTSVPSDLIVLDLRMPVMDGWEFRAAQRGDPDLRAIPVVAVSADEGAKAAAIDAQAFLRKPVTIEALLDAVGRILADGDRARLVRRLEEAERFAAIGRVAASVGHEINNPLNDISMKVDLALLGLDRLSKNDPEAATDVAFLPGLLRECRGGLDRIRNVVREVERLSQSPPVVREPFALNDLLDESLEAARAGIEHRAEVSKRYGEAHTVAGDRSALGQVFLNLLLSAAGSIPEGYAAENEITVRTFAEGHTVTVEIADTGPGIPPELLPHIFEPLFSATHIGKAMGLDLTVSHQIVADQGGRLEVESEVGRGSTFRVTLPAATEKSVPPREQ